MRRTYGDASRRNPQAKPGKSQATPAAIPGNPNCPAAGFTCLQAIPKTFEDEKEVEHFFQFALQTDYMHGRLSPRLVAILDPSGIFALQLTGTYRITDYLLFSSGIYAIEGTRRSGIATFRDRNQVQMRLTYQLN